MTQEKQTKPMVVAGKRKRAIAKATITLGTGKVTINKRDYTSLHKLHKLRIQEALDIAKNTLKKSDFDISVNVRGGGQEGQIEASRLAIAKAITKFSNSNELQKAYASYDKNLLVADVRRKEPNKPGDSKARAKRQKSFR